MDKKGIYINFLEYLMARNDDSSYISIKPKIIELQNEINNISSK